MALWKQELACREAIQEMYVRPRAMGTRQARATSLGIIEIDWSTAQESKKPAASA